MSNELTLSAAQRDMREAYYGGAPGMLISALAWGVAAGVAWRVSPANAVWALFIGGMLIHPLSLLVLRVMGRSGRHASANVLGTLALATTFWLILSLPLTYAVSTIRIEWFFPAMLFVIGGRYLTFATMFGLRVYWICGFVLAGAGFGLAYLHAAPLTGAATGALIEALFAAIIAATMRRA